MKKLSVMIVAGLVALPAYAGDSNFSSRKSSAPAAAPAQTQAPKAPKSASREEMKKKVEEKKKELNGSEWKVTVTSGGKTEGEDTLTFQNNKVNSKIFADKGFPSSNYTVTVPEGADMATWETMQTDPKGGVVFMRGEWTGDTMRGVVSQQLEEGKSKDYNFASAGKTEVPATTEEKKPEPAPAPVVTEAVPATPERAAPAEASQTPASGVAAFAPGTTEERG